MSLCRTEMDVILTLTPLLQKIQQMWQKVVNFQEKNLLGTGFHSPSKLNTAANNYFT
jgi:hypothetical protein